MVDIQKTMNWDAVSFDWNHIRAFLATVDHGSLSGAARALKQTQPTLSRQISKLEDVLGLTLFERGTRIMQLTEAGTELLAHVRSMADAATQISRVATGQSQAIEGTVRITSSDAMAAYALPPCLISLRRSHPGISLELVPSNEMHDLTRRDADIAIRHVRPDQPDLVAKRLADIEIGLFASASYLEELGSITEIEDFSRANFIGYQHPERLVPQVAVMGIPVTAANFGITTSNGSTMYELARDGAGIAFLPTVISEGRLGLKHIHPEIPTFKMETWLVTHREINTSRRIRITFDHLAKELAKDRWSSLVAR
ncbi:MAG: LysR family transcriptional regulator [Pseudomonadota bacterium]